MRELRAQLRRDLVEQGLTVFPISDEPLPDTSVETISAAYQRWKRLLLRCDAIVILNGAASGVEDMLLELWQVSSGHGEALKRVAIVDKPTEPPVEQFDPDIPVFRFDCPNFLGSFTDWIKQGEAATAHALLAPSVGGEHHATSP